MLTHSPVPTTHGWFSLTGPDFDVVFSSRVGLSRNLVRLPFPHLLNDAGRLELRRMVEEAFNRLAEEYLLVDGEAMRPEIRSFYTGRGILPAERGIPVAITNREGNLLVRLAADDHIKLSAIEGGLNLTDALSRARELDGALEALLEFAVSLRLGYLSGDIHASGTGLSASVMLHLPALEQSDSLASAAATESSRITLQRLGNGAVSLPSLYRAASSGEFGVREEETIGELAALAERLVHYEREARRELTRRHGEELAEAAHRALGTLSFARRISLDEALDLLGMLRLGRACGLVDAPDLAVVTELLFLVHDNQVSVLEDDAADRESVDAGRATLIRSALGRAERP